MASDKRHRSNDLCLLSFSGSGKAGALRASYAHRSGVQHPATLGNPFPRLQAPAFPCTGQSIAPGNRKDHPTLTKTEAEAVDLTLLFTHDLLITGLPLYHHSRKTKSFWVRYDVDGQMKQIRFFSVLTWRATMLITFQDGKSITLHDIEEEGRFASLFPPDVMQSLKRNAETGGNVIPPLKLIDAQGTGKVIVTRTRFRGHAVDVLHNLSDGKPLFQTVWIVDLLRLRAKVGIGLMPDPVFSPAFPISAYLEAASMTGRIVEDAELAQLSLTGAVSKIPLPPVSDIRQRLLDWQSASNPDLKKHLKRTIYDDYFPST